MDPVDVEVAGRCGLPPGGPLVGALALKLCAVRETFEETGLLLLQHKFTREELRAWRAKLRADHKGGGFADLFSACVSACYNQSVIAALQDVDSLLKPWARFITPDTVPKRFDAHFFLAVVGPGVGVDVEPDNTEATELTWVRPVEESLRPAVGRYMYPPQYLILCQLAVYGTLPALTARARSTQGVVAIVPHAVPIDEHLALMAVVAEADQGVRGGSAGAGRASGGPPPTAPPPTAPAPTVPPTTAPAPTVISALALPGDLAHPATTVPRTLLHRLEVCADGSGAPPTYRLCKRSVPPPALPRARL